MLSVETSQPSADADSSLAISENKNRRRDCCGQFQLPRWYRGNMLPSEVTRKDSEEGSLQSLEFGMMDEILNEKMTNKDFCAADMGRYLGVGSNSLNEAFWRHNLQKIEFGKLPPDTNISAPEIRSRIDKWKKYRRFTEQGGCHEPLDPEALAAVLFPEKKMEARIVKESLKGGPLPEWSGNWRQGGPATLAAQVSRIVPSRGQGDRPFPAPSPAEPPPLTRHCGGRCPRRS